MLVEKVLPDAPEKSEESDGMKYIPKLSVNGLSLDPDEMQTSAPVGERSKNNKVPEREVGTTYMSSTYVVTVGSGQLSSCSGVWLG